VSQIHDAKLAAMRDIATTGIAKLRKNKDQGYSFRGIEDAMNEMSPVLIRAGITVTPSYSELSITPSESKSGTKLRFATIKGSFKFEAGDGSAMVTECYGEGMDSSDKAVSKAQSVAYRTALFETFVVPLMAVDPEGAERPVGGGWAECRNGRHGGANRLVGCAVRQGAKRTPEGIRQPAPPRTTDRQGGSPCVKFASAAPASGS
jgi:hypothetical protein